MRPVRSAKSVGGGFPQLFFHRRKIAFGKDAVGVEYNQVFPPATFGAVITRLPRPGIGFGVIMDIQHVLITVCDVLARNGRAVLYNDDFKILKALPGKALQEFVHFIGAVVYGDDNGVSHISVSFSLSGCGS